MSASVWNPSVPIVVVDPTLRDDLAAAGGSALITNTAPGGVPLHLDYILNNQMCVDLRAYGADPSYSGAVNSAAFNLAAPIAIASNRPLKVSGKFNLIRTAPLVGNLIIIGDHYNTSELAVDPTNWSYTASPAAIITVNGNFYARNLTFNQNWLSATRANVGGYNDSINPNRWGGNFMVQVTAPGGKVGLQNIDFLNCNRGMLASNADILVLDKVTSNGRDSYAQCVVAAAACKIVHADVAFNALKWYEGASYLGNGNSGFYPYNCGEVYVHSLIIKGHQLVARGPAIWQPNTSYGVGDEYRLGRSNAYVVITAYTSGASLGPVDDANTDPIFYGMQKFYFDVMDIDGPIADTALYDWVNIRGNLLSIYMSGDMGLATSSSDNVHISHIDINKVRCGGIDLSYGLTASITSASIIDVARASDGVFSRIDQFGRYASTGGFALSALVIGAQAGLGQKEVILGNIKCDFETLPPLTDPNGTIRTNVNAIFVQASNNVNHFNSATTVGCRVADYSLSAMPNFFINVPSLSFYAGTVTGTIVPGEIFVTSSKKFILCVSYGTGGLQFVRKFTEGQIPIAGEVYTGQTSGATITINASPQNRFLASTEAGNYDKTTKFGI